MSSGWSCPRCTFDNVQSHRFCKMCGPVIGTRRPIEDPPALESPVARRRPVARRTRKSAATVAQDRPPLSKSRSVFGDVSNKLKNSKGRQSSSAAGKKTRERAAKTSSNTTNPAAASRRRQSSRLSSSASMEAPPVASKRAPKRGFGAASSQNLNATRRLYPKRSSRSKGQEVNYCELNTDDEGNIFVPQDDWGQTNSNNAADDRMKVDHDTRDTAPGAAKPTGFLLAPSQRFVEHHGITKDDGTVFCQSATRPFGGRLSSSSKDRSQEEQVHAAVVNEEDADPEEVRLKAFALLNRIGPTPDDDASTWPEKPTMKAIIVEPQDDKNDNGGQDDETTTTSSSNTKEDVSATTDTTKERMMANIKARLERNHSPNWVTKVGRLQAEVDSKVSTLHTGHHSIVESHQGGDVVLKEMGNNSGSEDDGDSGDATALLEESLITIEETQEEPSALLVNEKGMKWNENNKSYYEIIVDDDDDDGKSYMEEITIADETYYDEEETIHDNDLFRREVTAEGAKPGSRRHDLKTTVASEYYTAPNGPPRRALMPPTSEDEENFYYIIANGNSQMMDDDEMTPITMDPALLLQRQKSSSLAMQLRRRARMPTSSVSSSLSVSSVSKKRVQQMLWNDLYSCNVGRAQSALEEVRNMIVVSVEEPKENNRKQIVRMGGVMAVVGILEEYPDTEAIQYLSLVIIELLASMEPEAHKIVNELEDDNGNIIQLIARSMNGQPDSDRVQEAGRAALATVCGRQSNNMSLTSRQTMGE